jgi:hypothetical protein
VNAGNRPIVPDDRAGAPSETFRPTPQRRRRVTIAGSFFIAAYLLLPVLAILLPWAHGGGNCTILACASAPIAALMVFAVVDVHTAFTQVRLDGIQFRANGRLHRLPWDEVQRVAAQRRRRKGTVFNVALVTTAGKRLVLPAPTCYFFGDLWTPSPEFSEQYHWIAARWQAATGAAGVPSAVALGDFDEV